MCMELQPEFPAVPKKLTLKPGKCCRKISFLVAVLDISLQCCHPVVQVAVLLRHAISYY